MVMMKTTSLEISHKKMEKTFVRSEVCSSGKVTDVLPLLLYYNWIPFSGFLTLLSCVSHAVTHVFKSCSSVMINFARVLKYYSEYGYKYDSRPLISLSWSNIQHSLISCFGFTRNVFWFSLLYWSWLGRVWLLKVQLINLHSNLSIANSWWFCLTHLLALSKCAPLLSLPCYMPISWGRPNIFMVRPFFFFKFF